ncbi:diaminobutyrate--2-oxoglutarate transaminase [Maritalea myrionectae]|uniref:Diaminobutyrate--2-oxoglutarate transaminase n=1 Tax=Maritalea myrionectae TaxID=454601 RepID=A0A2R4MBY6_9HYPH|nr:aminotransferase class III-fold pyridoxal phosphate-dependent enzyme [Maritalea myrionectae]AVX03542.1 diaminobutyrate--2-oxoglutarate transaminase [Maritalea myrionectae]
MLESNFLKENNAKHMWHPMAHPADMRNNPPKMIRGAKGVEITDIDGHTTLDAVGGLWNANLGYSVDSIKQAINDQMNELPYYSAFRGTTNDKAVELSFELNDWFKPEGMTRAFFTSGGSDSVETCLRLARQYHKVRGEGERTKFISLKKGYHGTHFGGASVNGNANFRRNYEPMLAGCFQIAAPWTYRNPFGTDNAEEISNRCIAMLEDEIAFQGADTIAAMIMEPVLGAGGVIVPHKSFMPMVREVCDKHGILLIADEVITAFGRTGDVHGSRLWGVAPDMMCTAKAITNSYFPFGAAMMGEKVVDAFESNKDAVGNIGHGYTYSAHPVGCAAALATLAEIKKAKVWENAKARGIELQNGLAQLKEKHQIVGDTRGIGLMAAIELVDDRPTKTPASKPAIAAAFDAAYEAGVTIRVSGNNIILSPPLVISPEDVNRMIGALDKGLAAAASV